MSETKAQGEARLSWLQQRILLRLSAMTAQIRTAGTAEAKAALTSLGVRWNPGLNDPRWTPAKRAACSRSLRRLEQQGLIRRRNQGNAPTIKRTTHVQLLPSGEAAVQRLTRTPANMPREAGC
jgi:hypothetical protein